MQVIPLNKISISYAVISIDMHNRSLPSRLCFLEANFRFFYIKYEIIIRGENTISHAELSFLAVSLNLC